MTLKRLHKKFNIASILLISATTFTGFSAPLALADITGTGTGSIIIDGQQAAPSKDTSGNVTNYPGTTNDGSDQASLDTSGATGDGTGNTNVGGAATPDAVGGVYGMANVSFHVQSIVAADGKTPGDMSATDSSTYQTGPNGDTTITTDSTGIATATTLPDGYYLIHETTLVGGITPIADFIVQVVNGNTTKVYPKLSLTTANNNTGTEVNHDTNPIDGSAIPVKNGATNADWSPNNETTTAAEGKQVDMILTPTFDASMMTTEAIANGAANSTAKYIITENIDKGVTVSSSGITIDGLTSGTDYTTTVTGGSGSPSVVTITLTPAGIAKAAALTTDGDATAANTQLKVTVPTTVDSDFVGTVNSTYTTTVTNAYGTTLDNTDTSTTKETINVAGGQLTKEDASTKTPLAGAEFTIVAAASATDAVAVVGGDTTKGTIVDSTTANHTTTSTGMTTFEGLSLPVGTTGDGTATTDGVTYWAVETKAPTGYQLPSSSASATQLTVSTGSSPLSNVTIDNNRTLDLPFTGGQGILGILVLSGMIGTAAFLIRRHQTTDEEASY